MIDLSDQLTVFLISSGEPSVDECHRRLLEQDCRFQLKEICGVAPMDRAFQRMLDCCTTVLYVQVDADMLLEPLSIRHLFEAINRQPATVAMHFGWLWGDAEDRPIQGVKIYRHAITRCFPYVSSLSCEVPQLDAMRAAGYTFTADVLPSSREECLGLHYSLQTPEMAFRRQQRLAAKFRARNYMSWWVVQPSRLLERWRVDPSQVNLAAVLGAVTGLTGPAMPDEELNLHAVNYDYWRTMATFSDWMKGPVGLNLYATERCNARCTGCWRTLQMGVGTEEIAPEMVRDVLVKFPTLKAVCIAGFGEPLLHTQLGEIIRVCREKGAYVTVITNGLLLSERLPTLIWARPERITVSLNATTAAEHEIATGVPLGWGKVLAGINGAVEAGFEVALSYIARRSNVHRLLELLDLAQNLQVRCVDIPNLLPHDGIDSPLFRNEVLTIQSPELVHVQRAQKHPFARRVTHWPTPIDLSETAVPLRKCNSPFTVLGLDARGWVTPCRRLMHTTHGFFEDYQRISVWNDPTYVDLRLAMTGDRPLPRDCTACFGCWSG